MAWAETLGYAWLLAAPAASIVGAALATGGWKRRVQWAVFGLILPPSILWLIARRVRGEDDEPTDTPSPLPEPVSAPAADDDLSFVPEPVQACPRCGFLGIRPPGVQDGVFPGGGELVMQVCPRCDYRGLPLRFDKREDYAAFLRELSAG